MTDEDRQWLERHGFKLDNDISRKAGEPIYVKHPIDNEDSLQKIYIRYTGVFWIFSLYFTYHYEHIKFSQVYPMLVDSNLENFIERWNRTECIDMLAKMNHEYFIPEAMKN